MSDATVSPVATRQSLRPSRILLVACGAASALLIACAAVLFGHSERSEEALAKVSAPPLPREQPTAAPTGDTTVPSAAEVFRGREFTPEQAAPTF